MTCRPSEGGQWHETNDETRGGSPPDSRLRQPTPANPSCHRACARGDARALPEPGRCATASGPRPGEASRLGRDDAVVAERHRSRRRPPGRLLVRGNLLALHRERRQSHGGRPAGIGVGRRPTARPGTRAVQVRQVLSPVRDRHAVAGPNSLRRRLDVEPHRLAAGPSRQPVAQARPQGDHLLGPREYRRL